MKEDLFKRKFIATWQEICKIKGISPDIEIAYEELSNGYSKTPYPEINRRVTRLLRHNEFPDHYDIVELIERCNTKHNLGISVEEKAQLSREVFKDVGKVLKAHRAKDFKAHFGSHLTDEALKTKEDPASKDAELLEMLRKSLREGQEKLEELCEGFVLKQEVEGEQERSTEGDACESDESAEDEEEEVEEEGVGQGEELQLERAEGQDRVEDIKESSDSEGSVDIDVEIAEGEEVGGTDRLSPISESSDESKETVDPVSSGAGISAPVDSSTNDNGQNDSSSNGGGEENILKSKLPVKRKMSNGNEEQTKKAKMATDDGEEGGKMTTSSLGTEREQNTIILSDDDDDDIIVLSD